MSGPSRDPLDALFEPLRAARIEVDVRAAVRERIAAAAAPRPSDAAFPIFIGVAAQTLALCAVAWAILLAGAGGAAPSLARAATALAWRLGAIADALLRAVGTLLMAAGRGVAAVLAATPVPSGAVTLNLVTLAAFLALAFVLIAGAAALARDLSRPSPPWSTQA